MAKTYRVIGDRYEKLAQEELKLTGQFINCDVTYVKDVCLTI